MRNRCWRTIVMPVCLIVLLGAIGIAQQQPEKKADEGLPLKTTRTVEFSTDEGSWICVDVSPDGQSIVFDILGDLYLLPITGGDARRITSGPAWDTQARFSPDGRSIAFVSDRSGSDNVWLIDSDGGNPRAVTREKKFLLGSPAWTPDGKYFAVRRGESSLNLNELWLYHKEGGSGIQLTRREGQTRGVAGPAFSGDGRYLYFSGSTQGHVYNSDLGHFQVKRLDRESGNLETLTGLYGGGLRPVLSPDGNFLVYGSRHDGKTGLRARDMRDGTEQWLVYPIDRDEQEGFYCADVMPGYAVTRDNRSVIVSYGGKIHRIDLATKADTIIPFRAEVRQELAPRVLFTRRVEQGPVTVKQLRWPNESADGRRLTFGALGKVWLMDLPGGKPRRITEGKEREYAPSLSPDGQWVAYATWSDEGGGSLWKAPVGGGAPVRLTREAAFYHSPAWSPDGSKIVFVMGSSRAWLSQDSVESQDIRWIAASGGQSHLAVVSPLPSAGRGSTVQKPTFSSDGQRVFYLDQEDAPQGQRGGAASVEVRSARLDGSDRKLHIRLRAAGQAAPSPDGEWVAFSVRGNAYLTAMPKSSDAPTLDLDSSALPVRVVTNEGADDLGWKDGGKVLTWGFTNRAYKVSLEQVLRAQKVEEVKPDVVTVALEVPRPKPSGKVALREARIITMKGDEVIPKGDVLVEGNRITAVGATGTVTIPPDATVINVRGKTIMPGLLDLHDHFHPIREVIPQRHWSLAAHLAYGVTTSFDPSADNNAVFGTAEMVEAGELTGPRIYSTGTALNVRAAKIESLEDARHIVRRYKEHGAIALKEYLQPRRVQRQWIMMAAAEEGLNVTADGGGHLAFDMTHALDGYSGFEHSMPVTPVYKDVIELMAQSKTYYSPTLIVELVGPWGQHFFRQYSNLHDDQKLRRFTPHELVDRRTRRRLLALDDDYRFVSNARDAAEIIRRGGFSVLGGHGEQQGLSTHWELWIFQMGGLSAHEALRAGTRSAAECLGMAQDLGSVEAGKLADILVLNFNPLENLRKSTDILYVMKNGELFEGETMNQVWPEKKPFPRFYWQTEDEQLKGTRVSPTNQ